MRLGISLAAGSGRQPTPFWAASLYRAEDANGTGQRGPAAILDFRRDRHALTPVPAAAIPATASPALAVLAPKPLGDVIAFTRAGTATYVDADGLLKTAAADQPRFDYTNGRRQLLLEGPGTNLLAHSNDPANAAWLKTRTSAARTETGPTGAANDASAIVAAAQAGSHYVYQPVAFSAQSYTLSLRVKYAGHRWFYVRLYDGSNLPLASFDLLNGAPGSTSGAVTGTITPENNGYFRITVTATMAAGSGNVLFGLNETGAAAIENWLPAGTEKAIVHGAQLEAGSHRSSYIPTLATTVTRPADKAQLAEPVAALLRRGEASLLLQGERIRHVPGFPGVLLGASGAGYICAINSTGAYVLAGSPSLTLHLASLPLPAFGLVIGWNAALFRGCYNGGAVQSRSGTQEANLSAVYLGRSESGSSASGWYDQLVIWPFRMTDADLQAKAVAHV